MPRIRCTQRLLKALGTDAVRAAREDDSEHGDLDWYANLFYVEGRKCLIFVNAGTLFPVVALDVLKADFRDPAALLRDRYRKLLRYLNAPESEIERELGLFEDLSIGKTLNRSVLASLTTFTSDAQYMIAYSGGLQEVTGEDMASMLAKTPWSGIGMAFPQDLLRKRIPGLGPTRRYPGDPRPDLTSAPEATGRTRDSSRILADFLDRPDRPKGSLNYQQLLGFLFYVAASPEPINPSEWFTVVLGGENLIFDDPDQVSKVFDALMDEYNRITQRVLEAWGVDPDDTPLQEDPLDNFEDWSPVNNWCLGFAFGYQWAPDVWDDVPEDSAITVHAILLLLAFFTSKKVARTYMEETGQQDRGFNELVAEVADLFYEATRLLADAGRRYRKPAESMFSRTPGDGASGRPPKVGRNEPCPCGSGRKYKHCHGRSDVRDPELD